MNNLSLRKTLKRDFSVWHGISGRLGMRKLINQRELTLALGILVAIVIALTLWVAGPQTAFTGGESSTALPLASPAKVDTSPADALRQLADQFLRWP
jgi:hypothetical protein